MSDDLRALEDWVGPLLAQPNTAQRRALARKVGQQLRRTQAERIAGLRAPDGSEFAARKVTKASLRKGTIRRAMFAKLRTARYLRVMTDDEGVAVGFLGRAARIARVHQEGLRDQVEPGGPYFNYPKRRLLGFSSAERDMVADQILEYLTIIS